MEWGASRILALRKHAGMTQAQFARWLGVSIKQVKYLEHQRRNPSGPARRLLDILAYQLGGGGEAGIQVLGSALAELKPSAAVGRSKPLPTEGDGNGNGDASAEVSPDSQAVQRDAATPPSAPEDDAFVWS
jgi:transcriptional regulator with XRE-family HTH domain